AGARPHAASQIVEFRRGSAMSELPDDIKRALAALPRERQPDPALEGRVVRAVLGRRRTWLWVGVAAAAAAIVIMTHPWSPVRDTDQTYVLLLSPGTEYLAPAPGHLEERRAEYGRWADSLAHLGKLD